VRRNRTDRRLPGASQRPGRPSVAQSRAQHFANVNLISFASAGVFRDYVSGPQSWTVASAGSHGAAIQAGGVPILTDAGWLDAGTTNRRPGQLGDDGVSDAEGAASYS